MSLKYEVRISFIDEYVEYLRHGYDHRLESKPATIWFDGDMAWNEYGDLHRINGPAEIYNNYDKYHIRGVRYTKEDYESEIRSYTIY